MSAQVSNNLKIWTDFVGNIYILSILIHSRDATTLENGGYRRERRPETTLRMAGISNKANELVYLDVSIGKKPAQRITIELFSSIAPRSCKNFRLLCTYVGRPCLPPSQALAVSLAVPLAVPLAVSLLCSP